MNNLTQLKFFVPTFLLTFLFSTSINAQFCSDFGEGDFVDLCVEQMGAGTTGPVMSNTLDIYDAATGMAGSDGIADVQLTIESVVCAATDACGMSTGNIGACIGGMGALGTGSDFAADFNNDITGSTGPGGETTCENAGGYVCVTIDFLNGFSSTAMGFNLAQTSNNGSSEGYEGSFGYVTAGTDASGAPLTLPAVNLGNFCNYTSADYATMQMSTFLGATGPGTYQTDVQNTNPNNTGTMASDANGQNFCDGTTTSDNGEDTATGSGVTNGTAAATANPMLGLAPTDVITQVKHIYFYTSTPSIDCDGDGLTAANSNPSGSWSDVDFCAAEPPCTFPEPAVSLEEDCGTFNIVVGAIDESMASGTGTSVNYGTTATGPFTTPVTGAEALPADGTTQVWINVADAADPDCNETFGPFTAPAGEMPDCDKGGAFPANPAPAIFAPTDGTNGN